MNTKWNIYRYMSTNPENLVKIDSEIYLLQAIVEKRKTKKKVTGAKHKQAGLQPGRLNSYGSA